MGTWTFALELGKIPVHAVTAVEAGATNGQISHLASSGLEPTKPAVINAGLSAAPGRTVTVNKAATVNHGWRAEVAQDHPDATRSGFIADSQASSFEKTGNFGDGSVSFWWKVSSEAGYDYLRFSIDGAVKDEISGEVGWQQESYPITAGSHTLKWEYAKDGSFARGSDAAWVARVVLPPALLPGPRSDSGNTIQR